MPVTVKIPAPLRPLTANQGEVHEAMNFAGVHKLPVIFVCENNLYMEYTPISSVTAVEHPCVLGLAEALAALGQPGQPDISGQQVGSKGVT